MKTIILSTLMIGASALVVSAQNANISWGAATPVSGTSDVSTLGTVVGTWAPGDDWGGSLRSDYYPVNGVTFAAYGSGVFGSFINQTGFDGRYEYFNSPGTADPNYNYLLQTAEYSNGEGMSLTWGGMTPGDTYQLEFWVNDGRNSVVDERSETLTGGADTSTALSYTGTYIIGTFVADATGTETLSINPSGGPDIGPSGQVNLMLLSDITSVPEPSMIAVFAAGMGILLCCFGRKSRAA
jgi:hypothetical protein